MMASLVSGDINKNVATKEQLDAGLSGLFQLDLINLIINFSIFIYVYWIYIVCFNILKVS
jgi:hypothetical protein